MNQTALEHEFVETTVRLKRRDERVAILGLGYVGLPLAEAFADQFEWVTGYDISEDRIDDIRRNAPPSSLNLTTSAGNLRDATLYIVAVPTPITPFNQPDFSPLEAACTTIARYLQKDDMVVFESTVYPGATEEVCAPLLAEYSGLSAIEDFSIGYSPERINPGDQVHGLKSIKKLVAADSHAALNRAVSLYASVLDHAPVTCPSIKVAEAAKVLENTQRDVNIALMNEVSSLWDKIGISSFDVLAAAGTKWNFNPFHPGLVGGHCIATDPHYLSALANREGVTPALIETARRVNAGLPERIKSRLFQHLATLGSGAKVVQLGLTFKENVADLRGSLALELAEDLAQLNLNFSCVEPFLTSPQKNALKLPFARVDDLDEVDALILAVPHQSFLKERLWTDRVSENALVMDLRSIIQTQDVPGGCTLWRL